MSKSYVFLPSRQKSCVELNLFNLPILEIKMVIKFISKTAQGDAAVEQVSILSRPSNLIKGCVNLLNDEPCDCKLLQKHLANSGKFVDLKSDIVSNNCIHRRLSPSKEDFRTILSFDFRLRGLSEEGNVKLLLKDFGRFFYGLPTDLNLRQKLDEEQLMVVNHLRDISSKGDKFYFILADGKIFESKVPEDQKGQVDIDIDLGTNPSFIN